MTMEPNEATYTARTQRVLAFAAEEARALNHHYIGTEHILLGLLREEGSAADLLTRMQATAERIRGGLLMLVGRGEEPPAADLSLTRRAQSALALGQEEAQRLGSAAMEPEHVLLGLLREGEGVAAVILETLNVRLPTVRAAVQPGADPHTAWACSFCGKDRNSVHRLILGPGWVSPTAGGASKQPLFICNECVALCGSILAEEEAKKDTIEAQRDAHLIEKKPTGEDAAPSA